jgi:hypothetical protein
MRNDRRDIYFYDLEIRPSKKEKAVAPPLQAIVGVLQQRLAAGEAIYKFNFERDTLSIRQIEIDEDRRAAILLLAHTDPAAPNAVYSNPDEGTSRIIEKEPGEAGEYGAHVILSLDEVRGRPGSYLAVIEKVPTLGRTNVERLLNGILNDQYKSNDMTFSCEDRTGKTNRDGSPKLIGFRPLIRFAGHPSDALIRDLEQGVLSGITLVHAEEQTPLGSRAYLVRDKTRLKIRAIKDNLVENLWEDLKQVFALESKYWEEARIEFKTPNGVAANITVDTNTGNVLDDAYVRTARITGINPLLDHSSNAIVRHLIALMMEHFLAERAAEG